MRARSGSSDTDIVLIHDAVRPFVTLRMIAEVVAAARKRSGDYCASDAGYREAGTEADGMIERTVDRTPLWLAQTPQAFRRDWIETAHKKAHAEGVRATDDAFLVEWLGYSVAVVEGSGENIKVTRPEDLVIGAAILASRMKGSGTGKKARSDHSIRQASWLVSRFASPQFSPQTNACANHEETS